MRLIKISVLSNYN